MWQDFIVEINRAFYLKFLCSLNIRSKIWSSKNQKTKKKTKQKTIMMKDRSWNITQWFSPSKWKYQSSVLGLIKRGEPYTIFSNSWHCHICFGFSFLIHINFLLFASHIVFSASIFFLNYLYLISLSCTSFLQRNIFPFHFFHHIFSYLLSPCFDLRSLYLKEWFVYSFCQA